MVVIVFLFYFYFLLWRMIRFYLKVFLIIYKNLDIMNCSWVYLFWIHFKFIVLVICFSLYLNLVHTLFLDLNSFSVLNQFLFFFKSSLSFFQILLVQFLYFFLFRIFILITHIVFLVLGWALISFHKTFLIFNFHLFLLLFNRQILFVFKLFDFCLFNFSLWKGLLIMLRGINYALNWKIFIFSFFNL